MRTTVTHRAMMARINRKLASDGSGARLRMARDRGGRPHYWYETSAANGTQVPRWKTLADIARDNGVTVEGEA